MCAEKDKRIADLHDQITALRGMLQPAVPPAFADVHREANALLNGVTEQLEPSLPPEVVAEREALLSGTY